MNRVLLESAEIAEGVATFGGARAEHVRNVLHGTVGQVIRTGELNGKIGTGEIVEITERQVTVRIRHTDEPLGPWVDLILAPPRPRILKRLLPQLATLGVGRIFLVGAQKVEKDFWGATLLKEENYRPLFVDGLMQGCVSSLLPTVETRRNFRRFVADELDALFPTATRLVAHPYAVEAKPSDCGRDRPVPPEKGGFGEDAGGTRLSRPGLDGRLLLAIGPEGGWTDEEVELLEAHGFVRHSLGARILRTDTATLALLARLMPKDEGVRART